MGYTHYWTFKKKVKDITNGESAFKTAVKLFKRGLEIANDKHNLDYAEMLGNGVGKDKPIIEDDKLIFNGKRPDDCETFAITTDSEGFDFCKTARCPYDVFVCLALLCFEDVFGSQIEVRSDGRRVRCDGRKDNDEGWVVAAQIFNEI